MAAAAESLGKSHLAPDMNSFGTGNAPNREWGFTIYRTAYGPTSDQRWQSLLDTLQAKTKEHCIEQIEIEQGDPDFAPLWSLFRIDARSDRERLDGLSVDQVRELYNSSEGTRPMNKTDSLRRVFLLADDEVFSDVGVTIVKAVSADYTPVPYNPIPDSRGCRQRYFGWMKMTTGIVVDLWKELKNQTFEDIAPPTIGGSHLVVWEGGGY